MRRYTLLYFLKAGDAVAHIIYKKNFNSTVIVFLIFFKMLGYIGMGASLLFFFNMWDSISSPALKWAAFLPFFMCAIVSKYTHTRHRILSSGVIGEDKTIELARALPDSFFALNNVVVEYDGKYSELDLVIVGRNGVFVIETKNHTGTIIGDVSDKNIKQYKGGQSGGNYAKELYNPVKQVSTQVFRLSRYLQSKGVSCWTQGIVLFTNPDANVYISGSSDIPVFAISSSGAKKLTRYIESYPGKIRLNIKDIDKITTLLSHL